jgi:predicted HicB family RNase H-like nuclease
MKPSPRTKRTAKMSAKPTTRKLKLTAHGRTHYNNFPALVRQHHVEGGLPLKQQKNLYVRFPSVQLYKAVKQAAEKQGMSLNRFVVDSLERRLNILPSIRQAVRVRKPGPVAVARPAGPRVARPSAPGAVARATG